jgi:transposase
MSKETKYSLSDLRKSFPDDTACLEYIFDAHHSRTCSCGGTYSHVSGRKQFQCSKCRFQIAPMVGTIFEGSSTNLTLWFHAVWIFSNAKSGISAKELERQLGVTYKCAYRILTQIRKALSGEDSPLSGEVEMDTAYVGGRKPAGRNNINLSASMRAKTPVMTAIERGGRLIARTSPNDRGTTNRTFLDLYVKEGSTLMTDDTRHLGHIGMKYDRYTVRHGKGEYVRGNVHINTVEAWFSHVKRCLKGTFKSVSSEKLQSYLDAFAFHYNNRHNDRQRFEVLLGKLLHV